MATELEKLVLSISADTTSLKRQLDRATRETKGQADKIRKSVESVGDVDIGAKVSKSMQQMQADAKNLTFQLNDITQGLLGGQSPFQVMMQQGSQVSQILAGGGGVSSTLKTLGSSLAGMLNPAGLVANAFIFAAGMAVQYFTAVDDGSDKDAEALKKEQQLIDSVAQTWGDLLPTLQEIQRARQAVIDQADKAKAAEAALNDIYADSVKAVDDLSVAQAGLQLKMGERDPETARALFEQIEKLDAALKDHTATAADARKVQAELNAEFQRTGDEDAKNLAETYGRVADELEKAAGKADKLRDQVSKATPLQQQLNDVLKKMGDIAEQNLSPMEKLLKLYEEAVGLANTLEDRQQSIVEGRALTEFVKGRDRVDAEGGDAVGSLAARAVDDRIRGRLSKLSDDFASRLEALLKEFPGARISSAYRTFAEQYKIHYIDKIRPSALPGTSRHEFGKAVDITGLSHADYLRLLERAPEFGLRGLAGDLGHIELPEKEKKVREKKPAAIPHAKDLTEFIDKMKEATDVQNAENEAAQRTTATFDAQAYALTYATDVQEGLNAAKRDGTAATAAEEAAIRKAADAHATAVAIEKGAEVAKRDFTKAQQESQRAAEQFANQVTQMAQSALGGFINDLRNGVDAAEAFANMLDRVVDSLINMAINSLFDAKGPLGSLIGSFAGFGAGVGHKGGVVGRDLVNDGRKFSPALWNEAPRYHRGGVVGLRPGEVPIIAQRGEVVIPRSAVGQSGAAGNVDQSVHQDNRIKIDMGSGFVAANNKDAKQVGENIQSLIQAELVRQSRPGGLLRKVPA